MRITKYLEEIIIRLFNRFDADVMKSVIYLFFSFFFLRTTIYGTCKPYGRKIWQRKFWNHMLYFIHCSMTGNFIFDNNF